MAQSRYSVPVNRFEATKFDYRLKHPFSCYVFGQSSSGKSTFIFELLKNGLKSSTVRFKQIYYIYRFEQPLYELIKKTLSNIHFLKIEDVHFSELFKRLQNCLVVFDDLVFQIIQSEDVLDLMIGESHHSNFSVIIAGQYLFPQGRYAREIVSQCAYTFLFKNCRDLAGVERFAYRIAPRNTDYFLAAFENATETPYNCLLIDCKPDTPSYFKLRTYFLNEIQACYPAI